MDQAAMKQAAAEAALAYIKNDAIVGVGSGSTSHCFIQALASIKQKIEVTVASSQETAARLKALNIPVTELNSVNQIDVYVDGADEANAARQLIKGGGGALTREKILAAAAKKFVCIIDETKLVKVLGKFPVAVEVIPMARSYVAREILKMGGDPEYRQGFTTDNGNIILDVFNWQLIEPLKLEQELNQLPGVVCHGIFAQQKADVVLMGKKNGQIETF